MIVTCPACSSRYKFDDERLDGRSAKITCPSCQHVFVVHPTVIDPITQTDTWPSPDTSDNPAELTLNSTDAHMDMESVDFSKHDVVWKVRQGLVTLDFFTLGEVREALDEGRIETADEISHDSRTWLPIESLQALETRMRDVFRRIEAGETFSSFSTAGLIIGTDDDGDEDAPTMIVRTSSLNLDMELDEEVEAPPAAEPAFGADGEGDDPETETEAPKPGPNASVPSTTPPTTAASGADEQRSILPIVLLVLVIAAVIGLILYSQGMLDGLLA